MDGVAYNAGTDTFVGRNIVCIRNSNAAKVVRDTNLVWMLGGGYGFGRWDSSRASIEAFLRIIFLIEGWNPDSCFVCSDHRDFWGCFPPGVRVLTDDGQRSKKVEDVSVGDHLWNPKLKRSVRVNQIIQGPEKKDIVVVKAGTMSVRLSTEHPVVTNAGVKQALELVVGDIVEDGHGQPHAIEEIVHEPATPDLTVINFILERFGSEHDGLLVADGILVGDLTAQRALSAARMKNKGN
jgi:hypothetical protein